MLVSFSIGNFKSFADPATLSLVAHKADKTIPGALIDCTLSSGTDLQLLPAAAIYGANAAGKSNFLLGFEFFRLAVRDSQNGWRPETGTFVDQHPGIGEPARFELEFLLDGVRYRYGFTVLPSHFVDEWLYAYPKRKERMLFERKTSEQDGDYIVSVDWGPHFLGEDRDHESSERRTRENSLFLSSCAQDNQQQCRAIQQWIAMKTSVVKTSDWFEKAEMNFTSRMCGDHSTFLDIVTSLIRAADASIKRVEISRPADASTAPSPNDPDFSNRFKQHNEKYKVSFVVDDGDSEITLPMEVQSRGIQKLYSVAAPIVFALRFGELLFFDELESSMHPHVAERIVSLFQSKSTNRMGAQIVFSTHDTNFLDITRLRRDQIWFVEKQRSRSHLYPLLEFAPRKDENLEQGYLRGRYGAIPARGISLDWLADTLAEPSDA